MCLAIPGKVIEINDTGAVVDFDGVTRDVRLTLLPDAEVGDWVLVHAGFAIEKYDEENARKTLDLLREITDGPQE